MKITTSTKTLYLLTIIFTLFISALLFIRFNSFNNVKFKGISQLSSVSQKTQIALIYIGSSTCSAANDENFSTVLVSLKKKLELYSTQNNLGFTSIGVSKDLDINDGLHHLSKILNFNEVSVGNNYANILINKYVWSEYSGKLDAAIPLIIISKRVFKTNEQNNRENNILPEIEAEKIIFKTVGTLGISILISDDKKFNSILN